MPNGEFRLTGPLMPRDLPQPSRRARRRRGAVRRPARSPARSSSSPRAALVRRRGGDHRRLDGDLDATRSTGSCDTIAKNKVIASQAAVDGKLRPEIAASWLTTAWSRRQVAENAVQKARSGTKIVEDRRGCRRAVGGRALRVGAGVRTRSRTAFRAKVLLDYAYVPAYAAHAHRSRRPSSRCATRYTSSISRNCPSRPLRLPHPEPRTRQPRPRAAQVAGGADFSQVAQRSSTDTASPRSRAARSAASTASRSTRRFAAAADGTAVGSVSAPVKTQYGWHDHQGRGRRDGPALRHGEVGDQGRPVEHGAEGQRRAGQADGEGEGEGGPALRSLGRDRRAGARRGPPKSAKSSTTTSSAPGEPSTTTTTKPLAHDPTRSAALAHSSRAPSRSSRSIACEPRVDVVAASQLARCHGRLAAPAARAPRWPPREPARRKSTRRRGSV